MDLEAAYRKWGPIVFPITVIIMGLLILSNTGKVASKDTYLNAWYSYFLGVLFMVTGIIYIWHPRPKYRYVHYSQSSHRSSLLGVLLIFLFGGMHHHGSNRRNRNSYHSYRYGNDHNYDHTQHDTSSKHYKGPYRKVKGIHGWTAIVLGTIGVLLGGMGVARGLFFTPNIDRIWMLGLILPIQYGNYKLDQYFLKQNEKRKKKYESFQTSPIQYGRSRPKYEIAKPKTEQKPKPMKAKETVKAPVCPQCGDPVLLNETSDYCSVCGSELDLD